MDKHRFEHGTILTDDAVAELLAKEASDASIRYSSMGLEAFKSTKPSNKARPNTRFLGRIIKETTSHNAALLAKEAAEAQARLDDLTEAEEKKRRKLNPSASDLRRRQLGDISSILAGRNRRDEAGRHYRPSQRDGGRDKDQPRDRSRDQHGRHSSHNGRRDDKEKGHRKRDEPKTDERRRRQGRSSSPRQGHHRHRDRSPLSSSNEDNQPHHGSSRLGKSWKDRDLIGSVSSRHKTYGRLRDEEDTYSVSSKTGDPVEEEESDPLEAFIGPAPPSKHPVRTRGRGAIRGSAAMDSRFSGDYDPVSDVQVEPAETEDWDEAVETYRDRQKWKQQGAERLRVAGFTDEQIKQWEKGGEKDIDDVRWSKAGEKREWDRGKEDTGL
ncbi:hypothetical protein N657DRAFT_643885 [Parathielavia appendiculata]|uniref:Pre-mRNA-splicing factor 38B n=1 Tax=Parathielavia appendiculata TaxID=2587402 RepID=A0AAN6Z493_9PEZI|nr:hypothetical protein N657DRAFT_643885 [Parathielavia appendiculata]